MTASARARRSGTICPTRTTTSSSPSSARNWDSSVPSACWRCSGCSPTRACASPRRSADPFLRLLTATTTLWIVGQMFINVGYVVGLLPVTGLQLPLISAGGSSQATTLLMMGLVTNAARHEPEAVAALRAGRDDRVNRLLRPLLPEPYVPTRLEAARDRLHDRRKSTSRSAAKLPAARPERSRRQNRRANRPGPNKGAKKAGGTRRAPHHADRPVRRSGSATGQQPPGSVRSSVRYPAGQRKQGSTGPDFEGQRYG